MQPWVYKPRSELGRRLEHLSRVATHWTGSSWAFGIAVLVIVAWLLTGPMFGFSDTWQLIINTGTTIVTFLMVFLIQNTQNRDAKAIHLKLDELIRALGRARNRLLDLENMTDEEIARLEDEFRELRVRAAERARQADQSGVTVTG